jgi:RNA polymerase sigma-70 factor (ECF subfamily)
LCQSYWQPAFQYVCNRGYNTTDAEDLTQSFFLSLLKRPFLKNTSPELGRFRAFLLVSLKHFLQNEWRRSRALKRRVEVGSLSDQQLESLNGVDASPDSEFDRDWALAMITRAHTRLQQEYIAAGKPGEYEALKPFLEFRDHPSQSDIAQQLGYSAGGLRIAIHRLRKRFRTLVETEVRRTVADSSSIQAEMQYLLDCLVNL